MLYFGEKGCKSRGLNPGNRLFGRKKGEHAYLFLRDYFLPGPHAKCFPCGQSQLCDAESIVPILQRNTEAQIVVSLAFGQTAGRVHSSVHDQLS